MEKPRIQIWGDGAVKGNGKPEAIAGFGTVIVVDELIVREFNGHLAARKFPPYQSNNTGELTAIIKGLEVLEEPYEVEVFSDSEYVILGMRTRIKNWLANGWKTAEGEGVKNKHLWKQLAELSEKHDIKWTHIKGHAGTHLNERCDELAKMGVQQQLVDNVFEPMDVILEEVPNYVPAVIEYDDDEDDDVDY
jgi:ribonuclease HI